MISAAKSASGYSSGVVATEAGSWDSVNAFVGTGSGDRRVGSRSIRLRYSSGESYISMTTATSRAGCIKLNVTNFGNDVGGKFSVSKYEGGQ